MRTDGLFTVHSVTVPAGQGRTFRLVPFGDVHFDSPMHADDVWSDFCNRWRRENDVLFLGMGDYLDSYSTSERRIMYSRDLHESTATREEADTRKRVSAFAREIAFMRGKLIGLLGGNHYPEFADGTTGDHQIARELGARYLGVCSAIRLTFSCNGRRATVDIFAHHGKGGGQTAGGRMAAVERLDKVCEADIYLMGDNHARGVLPLGDRLRLVNSSGSLHVRSRKSFIGRTGSFLKAYDPGRRAYTVDAALPPASLGWISFGLTVRRPTNNTVAVEITAEQ